MVIYAKSDRNGNPTESLLEHTLHCIDAAEKITNNLPFSANEIAQIRKDLILAVAIHDVGKAATGFQRSLVRKDFRWGRRHEIISASFATSIEEVTDEIVFAIITHHKNIPSSHIETDFASLPLEQLPLSETNGVWKKMECEWYQNFDDFKNTWAEICKRINKPDLINGRKLESIGLNKSWFERGLGSNSQRKNISFEKRRYASLLRGLLITSDHLGSSREVPPQIPNLNDFVITNKTLRNFQKKCLVCDNVIIHAPTGSGKTIAALLWAKTNQKKNGRLYYCLPNMASIDAMFDVLQSCFGENNVGMLHSHAIESLYKKMENDETSIRARQAKRQANLAREMYFPIRVCTPHQILRFILRGRGWETMLAEFPNSCFIFDEIHAYEPRIVGLIFGTAKLVQKYGASVAFLSATFPKFLINLLHEHVGITNVVRLDPNSESDKQILGMKRHVVNIMKGTILSNKDYISSKIKSAESTLIICNHVPSAQKVYKLLKEEYDENIALLHSRFNRRDRNEIEKKLSKNPPKILVSTQVVEVSLNIDYEQAFLEPSPIDATIQRMGRVNRFGRNKKFVKGLKNNKPYVNVNIMTDQLHSFAIYNKNLVERSLNHLEKIANKPISETELVEIADSIYEDGYIDDDKKEFLEGLCHDYLVKFEDNMVAGVYQNWVENIIESTDGTVEVLPLSLKKEYVQLQNDDRFVESSLLLVPVRYDSLFKFRNKIDKKGIPWVIDVPYSPETGLDLSL